ncbi:MAG TPA: Flp family type IVb pilin [Actinomycetota bacterium]
MFLALYVKGQTFMADVRSKLKREDGAVATEYALLLVLIAVTIIAAATALGLAIQAVMQSGADTLNDANVG